MDERTQSLLESRETDDRVAGLRLVVLFEDQDASPHAERLLQDPEPEVREHAARALGVTRGGAATARLEKAAREDKDAIVRRTALAILGEVGEPAAARAIEGTLAKPASPEPARDAQDRGTAIESLRACGDPSSAPVVAALASDPDPRVRPLALHAWAALAPEPRAGGDLERLATVVLDEGPLWAMPAAALVRGEAPADDLGAAARTANGRELERAVLRALELPDAVGTAVLAALVASAPEEPGAGRSPATLAASLAARELARRGDARGVPLLGRALYGAESARHLDAACALAEVGLALGEPVLERSLAHASAADRGRIARALAFVGAPAGIQSLGQLLSGEVPYDRRAAALAFAALGRRDGVLELVRALDFPFRRERVEALRALHGLWGEGPAIPPLAPHAERAGAVALWEKHFARA